MPNDLKLLTPREYIKDAAQTIKLAKKRICLVSMLFADQSETHEIIEALAEASDRGVDVEIAADITTCMPLGDVIDLSKIGFEQLKKVRDTKKYLVKHGVKFHWLGKANICIFSGRTHLKWCVVDDYVYTFGGINLYDNGIKNTDFMFKIKDEDLAKTLRYEFNHLIKAEIGSYSYRSRSINWKGNSILIDGGIVKNSIIYKRACELTRLAEEVTLVSQYCPTGKLSELLKKKKSRLYFNNAESATGINKFIIQKGLSKTKNETLYSRKQYLHAKFIIFKMPNGNKIAITGSHNFTNAGVVFGTHEIALETCDKKVIAQLEKFFDNYVI